MNASLNFFIVIFLVVAVLTMIVGLAWLAIHVCIMLNEAQAIIKGTQVKEQSTEAIDEEDRLRYYQMITQHNAKLASFVDGWGIYRYEEHNISIRTTWKKELWNRRN